MPTYFLEGNVSSPGDDELRSLQKWAAILFSTKGSHATKFPEGSEPKPGDDEQRLTEKINAMLS